jgi:hypothetical protein
MEIKSLDQSRNPDIDSNLSLGLTYLGVISLRETNNGGVNAPFRQIGHFLQHFARTCRRACHCASGYCILRFLCWTNHREIIPTGIPTVCEAGDD